MTFCLYEGFLTDSGNNISISTVAASYIDIYFMPLWLKIQCQMYSLFQESIHINGYIAINLHFKQNFQVSRLSASITQEMLQEKKTTGGVL